ncbi:uncharacterized protein Z518_10297 [Rhinocladiella mackenziei CBS 650.93]|uniref:Protein BIG1 n=1 Tax=Rhinocladiella mackenziei CBS 650.93 TaxID=1442369 RepID=A0A0D2ITU5_9EURO|nr:uncharacterized protein Z518_10297 [Rhinocladiella mackenziei CBS 650.93]KIX00160.1 hypothetical protein Z518_10297 [Rhinocladiella mackenziei CBS 650.93]
MHLLRLCALALAAECAYGYLDTTPFFMFSTSELLLSISPLQPAPVIVADVVLSLSQCPSDFYILVSQQGVSGRDYECKKNTPVLAKALSDAQFRPGIRSSFTIADVYGDIDPSSWTEVLETKCGVKITEIDASKDSVPTTLTPAPRLVKVTLPAPSSESRAKDLAANDAFFASILDALSPHNYTVLYTTTRAHEGWFVATEFEESEYDMESPIQEALHMDLKRDLGVRAVNQTGNQTIIDGPLFDKYQFFTPGIFMGFLVGILLLSILYVGISAVASLQVTYAAFDKDTGPLAGKKQQ